MAQSILSGLFGPSPEELAQSIASEQDGRNFKIAQMGPQVLAGYGAANVGSGLSGMLNSAMGVVDPRVAQAQQRQQALGGAKLDTPADIRATADRFRQMGDMKTAFGLVEYAKKMENEALKQGMEARKTALNERKQDFQEQQMLELKRDQLQAQVDKNNAVIRSADATLEERKRANQANEEIRRQQLQVTSMLGQMADETRRLGLSMKESQTAAGNKPPAGYRWTANGDLERIPGGPADLKAQAADEAKAAGKGGLDSAIATLRDAYNRLEEGGGITSTNAPIMSNVGASISASPIGQLAGKAVGSKNQSARNDIAMTRPALLAALMKATGMSAKQIDSNAELKLWLSTATDPTLDVESNRRALDSIEQRYMSAPKPTQTGGGDLAAAARAEIERRKGAK
jgi:hypothetical protein